MAQDLKQKPVKFVQPNDTSLKSSNTNTTLPKDSTKTVTMDSLNEEENDEPLEHSIVYNALDSIRY